MIARFGDPERGGFFSTSADHEELIARRKEIGDHPIPSGNSAAALGLLRLAALTGERGYERQAEGVFALFAQTAAQHPESFAHLLRALDFHLAADQGGGPGRRRARRARRRRPLRLPPPPGPRRRPRGQRASRRCCASAPRSTGSPAAYVCERFACQAARDATPRGI